MCKKNIFATGYIYPKKQKMVFLTESNYKNLARMLMERIGENEFFNGTLVMEEEGISLKMRTTLIIYRSNTPSLCNNGKLPWDIVPVWFECEVTQKGKVISNEFSWKEFKNFLPLSQTPDKD